MKITVSAELGLSAEEYFVERDGAAFRSFIAQEMNLLEYEIVQCWKEGGGAQVPAATKIRIGSKPDVSAWISGPLASKLPEALEYFDEVTYQPQALASPPYELFVHSEVPFLGDKGSFHSRILIEPVGQGRCRHTLEQTIDFKGLWGLGAVAKKLAKKSLQDTFDDMPGVIDKWLGVRQELVQTPKGRARLLAGRPHVEGVEWINRHTAAVEGQEHAGKPQHRRRRQHGKQQADEEAAGKASRGGASGAAEQGVQEAIPAVRSPFAEVAVAYPAPPPSQPAAATESAEEQAGGIGIVGVVGGGGGAEEFEDVSEERLHGEASLGGTVWFSPATSLAVTASAEVPQPAAGAGAAVEPAAVGAAEEAAPAAATPAAQAEERRSSKGGRGSEGGSAGAAGDISESGYSASSEGSEDVEEKWGKCAPWRAFYQQHGLVPTRANHMLPDVLVARVISLSGRMPVTVHKVAQQAGGAVGQQAGGKPANRGRMRRMLGACSGRHSTAAE